MKRETVSEPDEPDLVGAVETSDAPPAEPKPAVSLSEWKKERQAEKEAFAKFRQEQEGAPVETPEVDELPAEEDLDDQLPKAAH